MKKIVFTFGRMNPPTKGHQKLINKVISVARQKSAKPVIYVSQSQDSRKNPLPFNVKVTLLRKLFPGVDVPMDRDAKTIFHVLKSLDQQGYDDVTLVVGSDRVKEFDTTIRKYLGKDYNFNNFEVVSAGNRDPDAQGVEGISASKMREFVKTDDFSGWQSGFPVNDVSLARRAFNDVKRYMKEHADPIAIFVSGGPASGKDLVIKDLSETFKLKEIAPSDLSGTCTQNLIINGAPEDFIQPKLYLENLGYSTAYVNVDISDEISKKRNIFRKRPLSEETRYEKWMDYNTSVNECKQHFDTFYNFNNSVDYKENPEYIREQLETMKTELNEKLMDGLKDWLKGTKSPLRMQKALEAYIKAIDTGTHKQKDRKGVHYSNDNENIAVDVASDFGIPGRKFLDWIKKNASAIGLDRKYMVEETNTKFERMLSERDIIDEGITNKEIQAALRKATGKRFGFMRLGGEIFASGPELDRIAAVDPVLYGAIIKKAKKVSDGYVFHEEKDISEDHGAGFWGTPELTKRLRDMTPGQEKFKLPDPKGDKYNEPRSKVYGTHVKTLKGKYPGPIKESYEDLKKRRDDIENQLKEVGRKLKSYKRNSMGMTSDDVKDDKWKKLKAQEKGLMSSLQTVNAYIMKNHKKERLADRKHIKESVGVYADERTARKYAYDAAMTQMDPWTTLHVIQHSDGTFSVMLDMNLRTQRKPGDKSVASYTSSSVKDGTQKDPSTVPNSFKAYLGHKGN